MTFYCNYSDQTLFSCMQLVSFMLQVPVLVLLLLQHSTESLTADTSSAESTTCFVFFGFVAGLLAASYLTNCSRVKL